MTLLKNDGNAGRLLHLFVCSFISILLAHHNLNQIL